MTDLRAVIFPPEPRSFAGRRGTKILLRAVHVLCAGVLTGSYLFDAGTGARAVWLIGTLASGGLILLLDLHESAAFLLQVRGLVTLSKIGLLAALPWFGGGRFWVLGGLVLVSVLSSHAPARIRYHLIFGGDKLKGATSKG